MKNWKRGETLMTESVRKWNEQKIIQNDLIEKTMIFSNFLMEDEGKSRELICRLNHQHPNYEKNAKLIADAPKMYEALKEIAEGKGRYDRDKLRHATNTIEDMIKLAQDAIL